MVSLLIRDNLLVKAAGTETDGRYRYCDNHAFQACNWIIPQDFPNMLCRACELNETIPDTTNPGHLEAWQQIEVAKHRLVYSLLRMNLPLRNRHADPQNGLAFRFLSDQAPTPHSGPVMTGHSQGVITINIAEADSIHREVTRRQLGEPYRTLIGHFRHEIGHYYWDLLIKPDGVNLAAFRNTFGDERVDYSMALRNYHQYGAPGNWQGNYISAYSTMHPWEDWAEIWAHYMNFMDLLETASAFGISVNPSFDQDGSLFMEADIDPYSPIDFDTLYHKCLPLLSAVNSLNRSMGQPDLYPFVVPPPVREKLAFVHGIVRRMS